MSRTDGSSLFSETRGSLVVAVHRLRKRYCEVILEEIAQNVVNPADVDDELCALM